MLRIKLVKSPIGNNWRNRRTVEALGLRKVQQVVEQPDNASIRGMIHHVQHMVAVEVVEGDATPKASKAAKAPAAEVKPKAKKGAEAPIEEALQPAEATEAKPKRAAKKKAEETA